jgi:hypothetical protein
VKHFITHALQNLVDAHDTIIKSRVHQTHNTNCHRRDNNTFTVGDLIYVSTADLSLPKGRALKLLLKYVGPFKILTAHASTSTYQIELPVQLRARHLHDRFHRSKLHPHYANDNMLFPHQEAHTLYDFGKPDHQEWLVNEILAHKWDNSDIFFQICWNLGDTTWEPFEVCKDLQALDEYICLIGVDHWQDLPQRN